MFIFLITVSQSNAKRNGLEPVAKMTQPGKCLICVAALNQPAPTVLPTVSNQRTTCINSVISTLNANLGVSVLSSKRQIFRIFFITPPSHSCMRIVGNTWRFIINSRTNSFSRMTGKKLLLLFDVDGTLTEPRKLITPGMSDFLFKEVAPRADFALVGGSDVGKIAEQMGGREVLSKVKYVFSENGLVAHNFGNEFKRESIQEYMGEEKLQKFINFALRYMSTLTLPVKRGTFIEFRTGLINISPVGRSCSQKERDEFEQYDKVHKVREKFIEELKKEFVDMGLIYSIGGQISFDVFPKGWDKTYCLNHIQDKDYDEIHFFGDKTNPGGNDHELFINPMVIGHKVTSPDDTMSQLKTLLQL